MAGLLEGVRVLELAAWHAGPSAGYQLGDMGADVVKIEDPVKGDPYRSMEAMWGASMYTNGVNIAFEAANRSKRAITLDLKKPQGREVLYELVAKSDVFITNLVKGVAGRLGIDYPILSAHNPRLIYALLSGNGFKGPETEKPAYDVTAQARSGLMSVTGDDDYDEPFSVTGIILDQLAGTTLTQGILGALYHREKTGKGQLVTTSLLGATVHMQAVSVVTQLLRGSVYRKHARKRAANSLANFYECADGKWIYLSGQQSERFWKEMCAVLGMDDLAEHPDYDTQVKRRKHREFFCARVAQGFKTRTKDEWAPILTAINIPWESVNTIEEVVADPQVLANDYVTEYEHPILGAVKTVGYPIHYADAPCNVAGKAPEHGEHTEEILMSWLGYPWEKLSELRDAGVIA